MATRFRLIAVALLAAMAVLACENVFTSSPLTFLQRDPANLSPEQQVQFGEDALSSGDPAAMADAYAALSDTTDPETQLLAADLALGAVELDSVLSTAFESASAEGGDIEAAVEEALAEFTADDLELMVEAAALVDAADEEATPTPEQYVFAAIGLLAVAASEEDGDISAIDGADPNIVQAQAFLDAATAQLEADGNPSDLLSGIEDLLP